MNKNKTAVIILKARVVSGKDYALLLEQSIIYHELLDLSLLKWIARLLNKLQLNNDNR